MNRHQSSRCVYAPRLPGGHDDDRTCADVELLLSGDDAAFAFEDHQCHVDLGRVHGNELARFEAGQHDFDAVLPAVPGLRRLRDAETGESPSDRPSVS